MIITPASLAELVAACLRRHGVPRRLLVGFSGGADSTALLLLLHELAAPLGYELAPVHFEHGLRAAAGRADAAWCQQFCELRKLPCTVIPLPVATSRRPGESLEATARRLRLAAWQELAGPEAAVALGHHADDRAENLLIRLLRGANCSGLTSLRSSQIMGGVRYLRPLLQVRKAALVAFLRARGVRDWREDHTNRNPAMRRNFIRQKMLPMLRQAVPETDAALAAALAALDADAAFLETAAELAFAPYAGAATLPAPLLRDLHPALRPRVLRRWLEPLIEGDWLPDRDLLDRLDQLLNQPASRGGESRRLPLPGGGELVLGRGQLGLAKPTPLPPRPRLWRWAQVATLRWLDGTLRRQMLPPGSAPRRPDANSAIFPVAVLPPTLTVRAWQEGDRMIPFGRRRPISLKKLFVDLKIYGEDRRRFPLLVRPDDDTILWVAGLRRSATAPLTGNELAVLMTWLPPKQTL